MWTGALLGVGHVARNGHLPGWRARDDVRLVAAADARPEGRGAFLEAFPGGRWYGSTEELLAREALDFVDIATPPAFHAAAARAALESSRHVLCEKPLVLCAAELAPLARLARERDRALVTVHNWKHAPALAKIAALLADGAVGRVRRCRWETLRTGPAAAAGERGNWRVDPAQSGGGVLIDHGWHVLYLLHVWLGRAPRAVSARLETRRHRAFAVEDTAQVALDYGDAGAEVFLTWAAEERANRVVIEGDRGALRLDGGRLAFAPKGAGAAAEIWDLPSIAEGSHHPEWFAGVVEEFLAEAREPARRGQNLEEAALCATLLALARESDRQGGAALPVPARDFEREPR